MSDRLELNKNLAQMLKGGVIMDVTTPEQAQAFIDEQLKELTIDLCPYNKRK